MRATVLSLASIVLACVGLFIAGTLSISYLNGAVVPCGPSAGCAVVDASEYSRLFGLPVAYYGFSGYALLLATGIAALRWPRSMVRLGFAIAIVGTLASAGLMFISFVVIKATCLWCVGSAVTMMVLLLVYTMRLSGPSVESRIWPQAALSAPLVAAALYGASYVEERSARNFINLSELQAATLAELAPPQAPSTGDPDAKVVLVEFADFACPACRDVHGRLDKLLSHQAGIRLVYRHFPQSFIHGHEASDFGAAASNLAAEQGSFWAYADKAFSIPEPPRESDYRALLRELHIPDGRLSDAKDRAWSGVRADESLGRKLGIRVTPVFVVFAPGSRPRASTNVELAELLGRPEIIRYLHPR